MTRRRVVQDGTAAAQRWRDARLAALGVGLGELSHDLRGVLSPALLAGERLQMHSDPAVRRSADVLVRAVERSMVLLREQLLPMRDGLPAADSVPLALRATIEAAIPPGLVVRHGLEDGVLVMADLRHLGPGWQSLFAHLRAQGAQHVTLTLTTAGRVGSLTLEHDGRPTPADGPKEGGPEDGLLELSIARDLLAACGASLGAPEGTRLEVTLRLAGPPAQPAPPAARENSEA